jgi:large subunit ribosomal protein L35
MPKIKTHKGASKRFKLTGSGKIVREKAFTNHILTKKSPKQKRRLGNNIVVSTADTKKVKRLLGK